MIVLDASAAIDLALGTVEGARVADRLAGNHETIHAPHLLDVEVAQALRRIERERLMTTARVAEALDVFASLTIERYGHEVLLPRAWMLRHNLTAYDAVYVALAEALDAPLITRDRKLRTAPGHKARIEVIT